MTKMTVEAFRNDQISKQDLEAAEKPFSPNELNGVEVFERALISSDASKQLGQGSTRLLAKLQFLEDKGELPSQRKK